MSHSRRTDNISANAVVSNVTEASALRSSTRSVTAATRPISEKEFAGFAQLLHDIAGIHLANTKIQLVSGRLARRLNQLGLHCYGDYLKHIQDARNATELQLAIDLLTTNETYFFREPKHFDFLCRSILPARKPGAAFRIWSAASSTGEEPYSIAMLLADKLGNEPWQIIGSDISNRVLEQARRGIYPLDRAQNLPAGYLARFCLRGVGSQQGMFMLDDDIRKHVELRSINLNANLPTIGEFDVVFLRNVMIYFNQETKRQVVQRLLAVIKPGGYLIIGHSESLHGITQSLAVVKPSIYRRIV